MINQKDAKTVMKPGIYESPQTEVYELQFEGPLCQSGTEELGENLGDWSLSA